MGKIIIAVLLSVFIAAPAVAGDYYGGIKVGKAKTSFDNTVLSTDSSTIFGLLGGYTFSPNFAVEAEYADLGKATESISASDMKSSELGLSAVGSFPINQDFSVYGKLGVASATTKEAGAADAKRSAVTYGLGGQYNASSTIGIRLGYDHYDLGDSPATIPEGKANLWSIGGVFKF